MRDVIIEQAPDVLSILTNHVLGNYSYAGANYVEFSVSTKDIMNDDKRRLMTENVFSGDYFRRVGSGASRRNSAVGVMSETAAASNADTIEPHLGMDDEDRNMVISLAAADLERGSTVLNPPELEEGVVSRLSTTQTQRGGPRPGDPIIPSVRKGSSFRPAWRKFYRDYRDKNDRQMWKFLAAFPRTRGVHLPRWDPMNGRLLYEPRKPADSPIDILATLATDRARLTHMFGEKSHEELLDKLAAHLCEDEALIQLFPKGDTSCFDLMAKFKESYRHNFGEQTANKPATLNQVCVVGIDCVGDEFGHPYCMFAHSEFIGLINECREIYPHFGVRIHAGEGLMRHSTFDELCYAGEADGGSLTTPHATFMLHVLILIKSITKVIEGIAQHTRNGHRVSVRIGHGIAFLYQPKKDGPFKTALDNFRALLRQHDIVCELNPTSNHMLLQHSFTDGPGQAGVKNIRTLRSFFELNLPVILCTDDDGIWDIRPCAKHGSHISVARELCDAIENGDIRTEEELARVTRRSCAFIGEDV
jgi:adenosine deaminase